MSDFFDKVQALESTDKVCEEIKVLNEKLFRLNEASPMWQQVKGMIDICHHRQQELMAHQMEELDKTPDVLEIGEIQSQVYTPEYSEQELLTTLTNFYSKEDKTKKLNINPESSPAPVQQPVKQAPVPSSEFTIDVPKFGAKK
jgi:hypothetical protein